MNVNEERYVVQPNAISRAAYMMPTMARRLIFLSILNVQIERPKGMKIEIPLQEISRQLGYVATKRYGELKNAINIASKQVLRFENDDGSFTEWMPWLTYCSLDLNTKVVTFHINEYLYDYVLNIRQASGFSILMQQEYLKLESRYSYRWFEIIMSRAGHMGKSREFYVKYKISDLKTLFALDGNKYGKTNNFKVNVIEKPIEELNEKGLGFCLSLEYAYKGNRLEEVTLRCALDDQGDIGSAAYWMLTRPKEFARCLAQAKRSLGMQGQNTSKAYELECIHKAIELLKAKAVEHEQ